MLEETERTTTNGSKFYTKSNLCAKDGEFQCYEKKKNLQPALQKYKNVLPITTVRIWIKALEVTMLPEIPAQHFKTINAWAVRFMQQRGLDLHQRTKLVQKLPMGHLEKLKVNHSHIINTCKKYNYLLGQTDNAHGTSALFKCRPIVQLMQRDVTHYLSKQWYTRHRE